MASHNRFGPYFRTRVIPVNPNTTKQVAQRTDLTNWSQFWRTLTDAQRAGWTALGATMTRLDTLGVAYTLTGLQALESINRTLSFIGATTLSSAPTLAGVTPVATVTPTATS